MKRNAIVQWMVAISCVTTMSYGETDKVALSGGVATWSVQTNTPEWNQRLGVMYTRQGCSEAPAACLSFVQNVAQADNVKVTLAIPLNAVSTATAAREYSQLSQSAPFLEEVSIDDFVDQYRALSKTPLIQPAVVVSDVISNLKSVNANLAFGATIYEEDLDSPLLQNASLPAEIRAKFDSIHLFIHYRKDGPNYPTYVQHAKKLFPNAHIVAGSYAYDRRAYVSCGHTGPACTAAQDLELFEQSLKIQVKEVKQGIVDHIEFYPGYFGTEADWTGWSNPRECAPGDLSECIANTVVMRQAAVSILNGKPAGPAWTEVSAPGTQPVARYGQSAAMDSANHRMIIFGGNSADSPLNDTWILTNADGQHGKAEWIPVTAVAPPPADYSQGMYDAASNRMIVFGGAAGTDVWVLTNANGLESSAAQWIQLLPIGNLPDPITDWQRQVYDPVNNILIVYDSSSGVWTLTHANGLGGTPSWMQLNTTGGPSTRSAFSAVYSAASNRMIVFGGGGSGVDFNDLWVLTGANGLEGTARWIPLPTGTATVPTGRSGHNAVYDAGSDSMTIFGGIGQAAETWTLAHASGLTQPPTWTLANSGVPVPDPRTDCSAVLDTSSQSMIVFGGYNTEILNTVMALSPLM